MMLVGALAALLLGAGASAHGAATPDGYFVSSCAYSHRGWSDPIVFPRRPFASHNHTFVGNVTTNAFSTPASLRRGATSCNLRADTSAYWAPTLLQGGRPVLPRMATIYYRRLTTAAVKPFPQGLRMIAGNSKAHLSQSTRITYWNCSVVKATFYGVRAGSGRATARDLGAASTSIPTCPATAVLELHVNFPNCWNGKSLDSADHKDHMAYSSDGRCPAAFPVPVPALTLVYTYPPIAPKGAILSSGGQHSGHADFVNAWKESVLTKLVDGCLDHDRGCGIAGALAPDTP